MIEATRFFIDGRWVEPADGTVRDVLSPADGRVVGRVSLGSATDVDLAVAAAERSFESYSRYDRQQRLDLLERILEAFRSRHDEIAEAISDEMGAPLGFARKAQAAMGPAHLQATIAALRELTLYEDRGTTRIVREPIGVCGLITPWNWPINQIVCKVAPALAAGCTVVLKPSEVAPLSAALFAEVAERAELPAGVFNMVQGDGATVGQAIAAHSDVAMVSFTGSTRAGILVAQSAASGIKRVTQELGGKSPNLILDDADFARVVPAGVRGSFSNSGQSCDAPTRMLVPRSRLAEAVELAREAAESFVVGDPRDERTQLGPVASPAQYEKIQRLIQSGIDEGATLVTGGAGRPDGIDRGCYVRPTVFSDVSNRMTIARDEVFGPVLCLLPYADADEAVRIANDTPYGLAAYVSSGDHERALDVASRLRAGTVHVNGAPHDISAPFGGYRQSGNGREWGPWGIEEYLETKAVLGHLRR